MNHQPRRFLMILGAMKAGTSALFHGLSAHPEILGSLNKEPAYWTRDDARKLGVEPYLGCWNPAAKPAAKWWMEGSTAYSKVPVQPSPAPRLRHVDAEIKFIFVTRNPVDRVRSNYEMALAHGWIKHPIHVELDPVTVWLSNYYQQVKPFVDCFGQDAIHVLSHEELVRDSATALRDICTFLGIDPSGAPSRLQRVNEAAEHRALRRRAKLEEANAAGVIFTEEELQAELKREITPTPAHVAHLHRELNRDLALFEEMFGIDPWTGERRLDSARSQGQAPDMGWPPEAATVAAAVALPFDPLRASPAEPIRLH